MYICVYWYILPYHLRCLWSEPQSAGMVATLEMQVGSTRYTAQVDIAMEPSLVSGQLCEVSWEAISHSHRLQVLDS